MPRPAKIAAAADAVGDGQSGASMGTINGVVPSANDIKFIMAFIGNLKSKPEVNWDNLAATMGLGGKKSASERWRLMRHKFGITLAEEAEGPGSARKGGKKTTTAATTKAAKKTGNSGDDNDNEDDDEENEPKSAPVTPAKRGRKPAAASARTTPGSAAGKKRAAAKAANVAASTPGGGGSSAASDEDMASPAKKAKGTPATASASPDDMEMDSPLSPVPGLTADEDSGTEMAV